MARVKKDTISREAFEQEMDRIKNLVRQGTDPELLVMAINDCKNRLIEYVDERDIELFRIPEWLEAKI